MLNCKNQKEIFLNAWPMGAFDGIMKFEVMRLTKYGSIIDSPENTNGRNIQRKLNG